MKRLLPLILTLAPLQALALEVPSGQKVALQEVLVEDIGGETWVRFRFLAPDIARKGGGVSYEQAAPDMAHLCAELALPYLREYALEGQMIVISLADRATQFGVPDPEATQFFEAYRPDGEACIWEGL